MRTWNRRCDSSQSSADTTRAASRWSVSAAPAGALRIPKVIVPATPGAFSALGVLLAEVVRDYSQTVMLTVTDAEMAKQEEGVSRLFAGLEREAVRELKAEGMATSQIRLVRSLA